MNSNYEDLDAAIRGDTAQLRDEDGNIARGIAFGLLFTAGLAIVIYLAWQVL